MRIGQTRRSLVGDDQHRILQVEIRQPIDVLQIIRQRDGVVRTRGRRALREIVVGTLQQRVRITAGRICLPERRKTVPFVGSFRLRSLTDNDCEHAKGDG